MIEVYIGSTVDIEKKCNSRKDIAGKQWFKEVTKSCSVDGT